MSSVALAALPRVAVLGGAAEFRAIWPAARALRGADFGSRRRPELRFDLLAVAGDQLPTVDLAGWLERICGSCRAVLLALPARRDDELLRTLSESRVLGRVSRKAKSETWWWLRGDLLAPLIRIDDYPTGVRPLPSDLTPIHEILEAFENHALPYVLGIVPGILTDGMLSFLRQLRVMSPAQHGYDHAYPRLSARLLRRGDPWNERGTVARFNEFRWHRYATVENKLRRGKQLLETRLDRSVTTYIPPCNVCDRATAKALTALGFELCLSERAIPPLDLPVLASDFYGRSRDATLSPDSEVICLHTNWEWDLKRRGEHDALPSFLAALSAGIARKEQAIRTLVACFCETAGAS